jgi:hypothetical protein
MLSIRVPADRVGDRDGAAAATILLDPDEALGPGGWLEEAGDAAPPMYG